MEVLIPILISLVEVLAPVIVGILTVPAMSWLKRLITLINRWPPWAQQLVVAGVATLITLVGSATDVYLPEDVSLWTNVEVSAVISTAIAFAIHAAKKLSGLRKEVGR